MSRLMLSGILEVSEPFSFSKFSDFVVAGIHFFKKGFTYSLQVTPRNDQVQYWADKNKPYIYIPVNEFVQRFKRFYVGERLCNDISIPYDKRQSHQLLLSSRNI